MIVMSDEEWIGTATLCCIVGVLCVLWLSGC